mmetsp:Transcript_10931/g.15071  ORF Transcript_10931/g.15071 Transcript_10931/m.15071 type:complete len:2303 (-) Transcript_10931:207-7115(-)|eukprot:CAMPEP_0170108840 /NCGR_PEP_ID=MMETSP0020_2-20130122/6818_1 /TAXON_ID=98059 /ORGANISM="Dinobryon sp., Strain UTEXLB2267" /LENGTH=2302 /DNA_ID=CAMNT_0010333653 /DNA_START=1 /DNA_END=6909 /DNA_ORIENTATION=-
MKKQRPTEEPIRILAYVRNAVLPSDKNAPKQLNSSTGNSKGSNSTTCISVDKPSNVLTLRNPSARATLYAGTDKDKASSKKFVFDEVIDNGGQEELFQAVRADINSAIDGYNSAILSFGGVGSGKTYSMFGSFPGFPGVIPRAVRDVFDRLEALEEDGILDMMSDVSVRVSFIELYANGFRNLLHDSNQHVQQSASTRSNGLRSTGSFYGAFKDDDADNVSVHSNADTFSVNENHHSNHNQDSGPSNTVELHEHPTTGVFFASESVLRQDVYNAEEVLKMVSKGLKKRSVGVVYDEQRKEYSSSSHTILTLHVETKRRVAKGGEEDDVNANKAEFRMGKIHFVDLAGSERIDLNAIFEKQHTGKSSVGSRPGPPLTKALMQQELHDINTSLLSLTEVVKLINKNISIKQGQQPLHVNYLESKLTHCLKDCIGGNCKTMFVVTVRPENSEYKQTLHTLSRAEEMRGVLNARKLNSIPLFTTQIASDNNSKGIKATVIDDILTIPAEYESKLIKSLKVEHLEYKEKVLAKFGNLISEIENPVDVNSKVGDIQDIPHEKVFEDEEVHIEPAPQVQELLEQVNSSSNEVNMEMEFEPDDPIIVLDMNTQTDPEEDKEKEELKLKLQQFVTEKSESDAEMERMKKQLELLKQQQPKLVDSDGSNVTELKSLVDSLTKEKNEMANLLADLKNQLKDSNAKMESLATVHTVNVGKLQALVDRLMDDKQNLVADKNELEQRFQQLQSLLDNAKSQRDLLKSKSDGNLQLLNSNSMLAFQLASNESSKEVNASLRFNDISFSVPSGARLLSLAPEKRTSYPHSIADSVACVNAKLSILDNLILSSRPEESIDEQSDAAAVNNSVVFLRYEEEPPIVCLFEAQLHATFAAVNDELNELRKKIQLQTNNIQSLKDKEGSDAERIRQLVTQNDELALLLAQYKEKEMKSSEKNQNDNTAMLIFANLSFGLKENKSTAVSSLSQPKSVGSVNNSYSDEEMDTFELLNLTRRDVLSSKTVNGDVNVTSIVQYPPDLIAAVDKVDIPSPTVTSPLSTLSSFFFSASPASRSSVSTDKAATVVKLIAINESELLAAVEASNQQLQYVTKLSSARERLCTNLTAENESLQVASRNAELEAQRTIGNLSKQLEELQRERLRLQNQLLNSSKPSVLSASTAQSDEIKVFNNGGEFRVEKGSERTVFLFCELTVDKDFAASQFNTLSDNVIEKQPKSSLRPHAQNADKDLLNLKESKEIASSINFDKNCALFLDSSVKSSLFSSLDFDDKLDSKNVFLAMNRAQAVAILQECNNQLVWMRNATHEKLNEAKETINKMEKLLEAERAKNQKLSSVKVDKKDSSLDLLIKDSSLVHSSKPNESLDDKVIATFVFKCMSMESTAISPNGRRTSADEVTKQIVCTIEKCDIDINSSSALGQSSMKSTAILSLATPPPLYVCINENSFMLTLETVNKQLLKLSELVTAKNRLCDALKTEAEALKQANIKLEKDYQAKVTSLETELQTTQWSLRDSIAEIEVLRANAVNVESMGGVFRVNNAAESVMFAIKKLKFESDYSTSFLNGNSTAKFDKSAKPLMLSNSPGPLPSIQSHTYPFSNTSQDSSYHTMVALKSSSRNNMNFAAVNEADMSIVVDSINKHIISLTELLAAKDRLNGQITAERDVLAAAQTNLERESAQRIDELADKLTNMIRLHDIALSEINDLKERQSQLKQDSYLKGSLQLVPSTSSTNHADPVFTLKSSTIHSMSNPMIAKPPTTNDSDIKYDLLTLDLLPNTSSDGFTNDSITGSNETALCALDATNLRAVIERTNGAIRSFVAMHVADLQKIHQKTKNIEDLKGELKKLQQKLNETARHNDLMFRNARVENLLSSIKISSEKEVASFLFCHLSTTNDSLSASPPMNYFLGDEYSLKIRDDGQPVLTIGLMMDQDAVGPLRSHSISSVSVDSNHSQSSPLYKFGGLTRKINSGSNMSASLQEEVVQFSFVALEMSQLTAAIDKFNRSVSDFRRVIKEKDIELAHIQKENESLFLHVADLEETVQEQKYRYNELEEVVSTYIRDIDALHKYSAERFNDVKSANQRVDEVLSLLKEKTDENELLLNQVQHLKESYSQSQLYHSSNATTSTYRTKQVENELRLQQEQMQITAQLQMQQQQLQLQMHQYQRQQSQLNLNIASSSSATLQHQYNINNTISTNNMAVAGNYNTIGNNNSMSDSERKRIFAKIDPDEEALAHGILLSKQLKEYGTTMYESLRPQDEESITEFVRQGYTREEAVLLIFESKFGVVGSESKVEFLSIPTVNYSANTNNNQRA